MNEWHKSVDILPETGEEVLLFRNVVQNTAFFLDGSDQEGLFWSSRHEDIDDPIPICIGQWWRYLSDVEPPKILTAEEAASESKRD